MADKVNENMFRSALIITHLVDHTMTHLNEIYVKQKADKKETVWQIMFI